MASVAEVDKSAQGFNYSQTGKHKSWINITFPAITLTASAQNGQWLPFWTVVLHHSHTTSCLYVLRSKQKLCMNPIPLISSWNLYNLWKIQSTLNLWMAKQPVNALSLTKIFHYAWRLPFIMESPNNLIVLGLSWLQIYNPKISRSEKLSGSPITMIYLFCYNIASTSLECLTVDVWDSISEWYDGRCFGSHSVRPKHMPIPLIDIMAMPLICSLISHLHFNKDKDKHGKQTNGRVHWYSTKLQQPFHISCMISSRILLWEKERYKASGCVLIFVALTKLQSSIIIHSLYHALSLRTAQCFSLFICVFIFIFY